MRLPRAGNITWIRRRRRGSQARLLGSHKSVLLLSRSEFIRLDSPESPSSKKKPTCRPRRTRPAVADLEFPMRPPRELTSAHSTSPSRLRRRTIVDEWYVPDGAIDVSPYAVFASEKSRFIVALIFRTSLSDARITRRDFAVLECVRRDSPRNTPKETKKNVVGARICIALAIQLRKRDSSARRLRFAS